MTQENEKLKKDLKTKEQEIAATGGRPLLSSNTCNIEALSSLTKKLQEISTTYDDVRRDMTKLQQVQSSSSNFYNDSYSGINSNALIQYFGKCFSRNRFNFNTAPYCDY
jgi:hypothetical protein